MGNEGLTVHLCSFPCSLRGGMPGIDRYQPTKPCQRCIVQSVRGRTHSCSSSGKINAFGQQEGNSWCHPNHPSLLHRTLKKKSPCGSGAEPWIQTPAQEQGCCFTYSVLSKGACLHRGRTEPREEPKSVHTHSRTGTCADGGHAHTRH